MVSKKEQARNILIAALGVCVLLTWFVVVGSSLVDFVRGYDFDPLRFDSTKWQATPSEFSHNSVRLRMADDFLKSQRPVGRSRADVVGLLGPPDVTTYFANFDMVYHLGAERSTFAIDSEWLVMRVDDNGMITEARLVRD